MSELEFRNKLQLTCFELCGGGIGVPRLHALALEVTEGRNKLSSVQKWKHPHSSCGCLVHCCCEKMEIFDSWVNRDSLKGRLLSSGKTHPGYQWNGNNPEQWNNLSKLYRHPCFKVGKIVSPLKNGAMLYVRGSFDHVCLVFEHVPDLETCTIGQYGGTFSDTGIDGSWTHGNQITSSHLGTKKILGSLDLWDAYQYSLRRGNASEVYA